MKLNFRYILFFDIQEHGEKVVFAVLYDKNDAVIESQYKKVEFTTDGPTVCSFEFEAQSKPIASIKAFVLDDFTTLEPLAESVELTE